MMRRSIRGLTARAARPEDLLELVRRRDLELIVAAVVRILVGTPAQEDRGVAKAIALKVVVLHLAHAVDPYRLPRQIFPGAPSALPARHPRELSGRASPLLPRMSLQRVLPQRLALAGQMFPHRPRERG